MRGGRRARGWVSATTYNLRLRAQRFNFARSRLGRTGARDGESDGNNLLICATRIKPCDSHSPRGLISALGVRERSEARSRPHHRRAPEFAVADIASKNIRCSPPTNDLKFAVHRAVRQAAGQTYQFRNGCGSISYRGDRRGNSDAVEMVLVIPQVYRRLRPPRAHRASILADIREAEMQVI